MSQLKHHYFRFRVVKLSVCTWSWKVKIIDIETKGVDPVVTAHKRVSNQKILDAVDSIHNEKIETIRTWSFR